MKSSFHISFFLLASTLIGQLPTPHDIWKNFDADAGDFNEEILLEEITNGIYRKQSYISAYHLGEEIRVHCRYAIKANAKNAPGLMDVHGWMGAPNPDLKFVNEGWAVMAHDYCGKTGNRQHFTKYPPRLSYGNMEKPRNENIISRMPDGSELSDPKQTQDYLWYAIQRRVLSYLLAQKEVDPTRIGAKGYSYGGTIMWNLGMDPRVKAVVAYFGVGWLEYFRTRGVWMYNPGQPPPPMTPGEKLYLSAVAPQAHAPYITAASLWLNGTNDHHGGHERGEETFKNFRADVPWSFAHQPRGHHDTQDIGHNTKLWLDKHVLGKDIDWPGQAESKIVLSDEGIPTLRVTPDSPEKVEELKMYYALKNPVSFGRSWRDVEIFREGNEWIGKMPVLNVDDYVFGFSSIRYNNSIVRSSPFTAAIPSKLGNANATDKPSTNLGDGTGAWTRVGPAESKGIKGFRPLTNRGTLNQQFSDPKWKAPAGTSLAFQFYCTQPQDILVVANNHNQAKVTITASADWQDMVLDARQFKNRFSGQPYKDFSNLQRLDLKPTPGNDITKVVFANFKWIRKGVKQQTPKPAPKTKIPVTNRVYLTLDMASSVESFAGAKQDLSWSGKAISVGGKIYKKGLGVHADSKITFPLDGNFSTFNVVAGPDDAHHGLLEMKIILDGKDAWSSGPTRSADKSKNRKLLIPVRGVKEMTLVVSQSDRNKGGDHASWADAYLQAPPPETRPGQKSSSTKSLPQVRGHLEPFLQSYCIKCHGPKRQKGQVRFDTVDWKITNNDNAQRWQDVLDQLNGGDMPPEDAKQPTYKELTQTLDILTGAVLEARDRLTDHGGEIKMRRLNRREYAATIEDLFGFQVLPHMIPEDGDIASFDTVGEEQFFTSSNFEKYLELGRKVAQEALRWNTSKHQPLKTERREAEDRVTKKMRETLADMDKKKAMKEAGATWKEMGFKDEGAMQILFRQWDSRAEYRRTYLQYPHVDTGVYLCDVAKWTSVTRHTDIRAEYIVRIHGGVVGNPDPIRKIVRLYDRDNIRGTLQMQGTPEKPETVEIRLRQHMGRILMGISIKENIPDFAINTTRGYLQKIQGRGKQQDPWSTIWIDWMEIEGPFYTESRPKLEEILYPGIPTGTNGPYLNHDTNAREFIQKFTYEAFRRQEPQNAYIDQLHNVFKKIRSDGKSWREAMQEVMGIVLASPGFLFLQEENPETNKEKRQLNNRELAIRLSYFLWSCPPDEELYATDLSNSEIYSQQIDRLLADPKSKAFRDGFISQWAELDRYDAITVDMQENFRFNEGLREDAKKEVREFFGTLIEENLPVSNLIDSDFVTINPALATHYGLKNTQNGFQKYNLPKDSPRGGLMTQTAFLTTGSNGERSSPVIRGALVMEKLLHDKPAPPPPNVPELGSNDNKPKTNREMVEIHQKQAVCASCHKKMDIIGFGLENFDTIGRWRDTEKVGNRQVPIHPGGTLPDGSAFNNVQELKTVLLQNEDHLAKELLESILSYALGRTTSFADGDDIEAMLTALKTNNYPIRDMIREIALNPLFKQK